MQQSSMVLFCDECGLANEPGAGVCAGCRQPLVQANVTPVQQEPILPVTVVPQPVRAVTPGAVFTSVSQGIGKRPRRYSICDFQPGSLLAGRYEIQEEIGSGGFSTVYKAIDQQPGYYDRVVAIKRIQLSKLTPRQVIDATETFNREVSMLMRFRSVSGIPAYYEHLTDAENWYLITQYIEGETLDARLQKAAGGFLEEKEVLQLGMVLADLLQKLHSLNPPVIFRDLKPENIMLTPDNTFFLIDFGIAREFRPEKSKDTTPLGSPGYAAPEQYGGAQTDQRTDVYGLGATLQTLLTGRDPLELRSGEPSRNPTPPSPGLRKLLDEMLAPEMTKRPADIGHVKKRLEYLLNRPAVIFLSGWIFGVCLGLGWIISSLPALSGIPGLIPVYVSMVPGFIAHSLLKRKAGLPQQIPKGLNRFQIFGVLVGVLPGILFNLILHWPSWR